MKKKCYYAHTMLSYGSTIETQDIKTLEYLGFEVINPNTEIHKIGCQEYCSKYGKENVMQYFSNLIVKECNIVAFRSLPNGNILSGISSEIQTALKNDIPIIELPCSLNERMMNYPETKQFLVEIGHYKQT